MNAIWKHFHYLIRAKQLITMLTFIYERKLTITHIIFKWLEKRPLLFSPLQESGNIMPHFLCLGGLISEGKPSTHPFHRYGWVFPRRQETATEPPFLQLPLDLKATHIFVHFFLFCGNDMAATSHLPTFPMDGT